MIDDLNTIRKDIQEYVELNLEILKLNIAESVSRLLSMLFKVVVVIFLTSIILLFLSISAAFWLGDILNSTAEGFLIVGGVNLLLLLIFLIASKHLVDKPVIRSVIKLFSQK